MSRNRVLLSKSRFTALGAGVLAAAALGLATPAGSVAAPQTFATTVTGELPPWCPQGGTFIGGTSGDDVIVGTPGKDIIDGRGGNDRIDGLRGDDVIKGGDGDDIAKGGSGADCVDGGRGVDRVEGGDGDDYVGGGPGPDKDSLDGGDGFDDTVKRQNRDSHARLEH